HSVLVPLDGSRFGEQALPLALSIARRANISVDLVTVHVPPASMFAETAVGFESTLDPRVREQERAYLDGVSDRIRAVSTVHVRSVILDGAVAETIRAHAQKIKADLIVMTTHGRGPLSRFWLGSVADQLVRRSPIPVLLVPPANGTSELVS